jgi:ABC-type amino acid transport substrate-binding protein
MVERRKIIRALGTAVLLALSDVAAADQFEVIYPRNLSATDSQYDFDYELLRQALAATTAKFGDFIVRPSELPMTQGRAEADIVSGKGDVTIMSRSTSIEKEAIMLPIRIPIDRGLMSYKVFLIRADRQNEFSAIKSLDELRKLSVGSFPTWIDTKILQDAGLTVVTGDTYEGLFAMLNAGRFDFFMRDVDQAYRELDERQTTFPEMTVEKTILLYYPTTRYFFVQRGDAGQVLARRVEEGLNMMIADGTYDKLFQRYKAPMLERADLKDRKVFRIKNNYLSRDTPLGRKELWYRSDLSPAPAGEGER